MKLNYVIFLLIYLAIFYSCQKDNLKQDIIEKQDPIIIWENPEDIVFGTALTEVQLNAITNVKGIFKYTPEAGTQLEVGEDQELKVDFNPADSIYYNKVQKTAMINVLPKVEVTKYDTIKPLPYLPVYPGSYWIYSNGDSVYTDPDYKLNSYYLDYAKLVNSDTVYVPRWRQGFWGQNVYVYGYHIPSMNSIGLSKIISENEGEQWQVWTDQRVTQHRAVTYKKDTSITLNNVVYDSVLIVDYYSGPDDLNILFEHNTRLHYAKNIGLIKVDRNVGYASDTIILETVSYLTKYFINK